MDSHEFAVSLALRNQVKNQTFGPLVRHGTIIMQLLLRPTGCY